MGPSDARIGRTSGSDARSGGVGDFVLNGLLRAFGGEHAFGFWRDAVARTLFDRAFPDAWAAYAGLTDSILGGSIVGKWVAIAWLVHEPLRRRERWALKLLLLAHGAWFAVDAAASVRNGAAVNVLMIDLVRSASWAGSRWRSGPTPSTRHACLAQCARAYAC